MLHRQRDCMSECLAKGNPSWMCDFDCHGSWPDQPSWGPTISYPVNPYSPYLYPTMISRCYWDCIGPGLCAWKCDGPIYR